ncbi:hypothetical protein V6N12_046405 [Hibiscus sabdariffa]|uniref:Uncharacterized protein n=1 Tax=Hibiscus sabdariffa TaxID=183260 RepID=A0ABR2DK62_9ROSI
MGVVPDEGCEDGGSVKTFNDEGCRLCNGSEVRYDGEGGCFSGDGRRKWGLDDEENDGCSMEVSWVDGVKE